MKNASTLDRKLISEQTDEEVDSLFSEFAVNHEPVKVSFRLLCEDWRWAKRSDKFTHYLHRYPAKLLPYIPIFFLSGSMIQGDAPILDSFSGSGTVGLESIAHPFNPHDCYLNELNPVARLISAVKVTPIETKELKVQVEAFNKVLQATKKPRALPDFPGKDFWFRKKAQKDLAGISHSIEKFESSTEVKDFLWANFSAIVRDMSRADPRVAPPVKLTFEKFKGKQKKKTQTYLQKKNRFEAQVLFRKVVNRNSKRMAHLWNTMETRGNEAKSTVIGDDSRKLIKASYLGKGQLKTKYARGLPSNSVGAIITSPPYISAQKYARTTKLELWCLGLIDPNSESFSKFAKSIIGTDLISVYDEVVATGNFEADKLIGELILEGEGVKAKMVQSYFSDMQRSIREMYRVLIPGKYCVLIVGDNLVNNRIVQNHQILCDIAQSEGFLIRAVLVDEIRSRGMITKRHSTAGMIKDEWVLVFQKPS